MVNSVTDVEYRSYKAPKADRVLKEHPLVENRQPAKHEGVSDLGSRGALHLNMSVPNMYRVRFPKEPVNGWVFREV